MKLKKVLSAFVSLAMLASSMSVVMADEADFEEKVLAAQTASELNELLLNPDESFSVDLTDYSTLRYPIYAAEYILAEEYSDISSFGVAYEAVMADMLTTSEVSNYDLGANLTANEDGSDDIGVYPGLEIRTTQVYNGTKGEGFEGYVWYEAIANPALISKVTAVITGNNEGTSTNERATCITGYSTALPQYRENVTKNNSSSTNNVDYAKESDEYNSWVDWSATVTSYVPDKFSFAVGSKISNEVDISGVVEALNSETTETAGLIFRFSKPENQGIGTQRINGMKLNITYDNTIAMYNAEMAENAAFNKVYEVRTDAEQLKAVIDSLSADELNVLGIDLTKYNTLAYPLYAVKKLVETGFENAAGFKTAFDTAVDSMFEVVEVANYDLGANLTTDDTGYADWGVYPGVEIKTSLVYNGSQNTNIEGFVMYNSIENPSAIVDIKALATGSHTTGRDSYITGYSTVLPQYRENKNNTNSSKDNPDYAKDSTEYASWVTYSSAFTSYVSDVFTFDANKVSNEVTLTDVVTSLNELTTDETPLVLKFSRPDGKSTANQRINNLKLTITYDSTIGLYNEEQLIANSFKKIYEVKDNAEALDEVLSALTSDEAEIVGIDMTVYNKLANSLYAAEELAAKEWETKEEFAEIFNTVVSGLTRVEKVSFDFGAVVSTDPACTENNKYGLQFKSGLIRNGYYSGVTGYAMYYSIENPYAIMNMSADVTGYNPPSETNNRNIHITGYSTSELTRFVDESDIILDSKDYYYEPDTAIYNSFGEYADSFAPLSGNDEIIVEFAATDVNADNKPYKEGVDFDVIADAIKNINKASTPLALKFSGATKGNSISAVDLIITYDLTAVSKFDEGVLADINSIIDATADAEVLSIGNEYALKLLGDSYGLYTELANSVRVGAIRELAKAQCGTIDAMNEKAVEIVSACEDVAIKYTVEDIDLENNYVTIRKNTNSTGNFELVLAGYASYVLDEVMLINNTELSVDPEGVYNDYRDVRYGSDGETFKLYIGGFDTTTSDSIKVMILNNLEEIKPIAKVFVK